MAKNGTAKIREHGVGVNKLNVVKFTVTEIGVS
jgi:hypothetical protein